MGPLVGVNGDDSNMDMAVEEEADGSKGTLGDSYVRQLQPFNMYPFSCNRAETLSLCRKERREASRLCLRQKKSKPYHQHQTQTRGAVNFSSSSFSLEQLQE